MAIKNPTVAVVILTFNEELNIAQALDSVAGWANEILILDSFSTDGTLEIVRRFQCQVAQHEFENYSKQRNYALDHLPIQSEWVLFLDADEWLPPEIKHEISLRLASMPIENGFALNRRLIWMGRWIRRGYYPSRILRLFRRGSGRCEDRAVNEHIIVEGQTGEICSDFMHEDRKGVADWIAKHNRYSLREAAEFLAASSAPSSHEMDARLCGTQAERKRWLRHKVWNRLPPLVRPLMYFLYRYVLAGGFLDGKEAFIYHFLHALWYPMLIDIQYLEIKKMKMISLCAKSIEEPANGL